MRYIPYQLIFNHLADVQKLIILAKYKFCKNG